MNNKKILSIGIITIIIIIIIVIFAGIVTALDKSRKQIGADLVNELGVDGKGNTICLIDDGVDYTNEYLGDCTKTQYEAGTCPTVIVGRNIIDGDTDILPNSDQFHGTHIAGILISSHTKYKGIAPNAKIAAIKVFSDVTNSTNCQAYVDSIDWCVNNHVQYNISVISLSYGLDECEDSYSDEFTQAINTARKEGILFVKSSGNRYPFQSYNMTFPAKLANVTSVGSVSTYDNINDFTRREPELDLLAPGHKIRSTKTGGGLSPFLNEILCFDDSISPLLGLCDSGTSYATPHVAAAATLMREYDTAISPSAIQHIFEETGKKIYDSVTSETFSRIDLPSALGIFDWPTYHHDNRRTGFTLLKGNLKKADNPKSWNYVLTSDIESDALARHSIADIDRDGDQEVIVTFNKGITYYNGTVVALRKVFGKTKEYWSQELSTAVSSTPSIGNTDGDDKLEVVMGVGQGKVRLIDTDGDTKWSYQVQPKYSSYAGGWYRGKVDYTAIADIDNDGKGEIIFTDYYDGLYDWPGTLYILKDEQTNPINATINLTPGGGEGGAFGAPAIANLDDDDNLEIVVPSYYGIRIYDYDSGTLSQKCSSDHGKLYGTPVIYDVDRDNKYEIIFVTANTGCNKPGFTCYNKIYIYDPESCSVERTIGIDIYPVVGPAIANLDSNSNLEIVIQGRTTPTGIYDRIQAYHADTGNQYWNYGYLEMIDVAPNIVDINSDQKYEILLAESNDKVLILTNDGLNWTEFALEGLVGSSPIVGDLSGKGVAELAVKRASSPIAVFTVLTINSSVPTLYGVSNITAIAGELVNINKSGLIRVSDPDNNNVSIFYSSPFNESGLWQSTINDTGEYSILIEASNGNLSNYQYVTLNVFNDTSTRINTFADNSSIKTLSFAGGENKSIQIRIPKNASILYSALKIEGLAP